MAAGKLFDASAVVDVLLGESGASVSPAVLFDEHVLDLTIYEAGNTLRKIGVARDELSEETLRDAMELLAALPRELSLETARAPGLGDVSEIAREEGVTFYDAAYLAVATERALVLVTEDVALGEAAGEDVNTASVADLDE